MGLVSTIVKLLFGLYGCEPEPEVFTGVSNAEDASPALLELRGVRTVLLMDAEAGVKFKAGLLKMLRDQSADIKFLAFFSANMHFEFNAIDGGVERSFTGIPWPFDFNKNPQPGTKQRIHHGHGGALP